VSTQDRRDDEANRGNWILPSSIAFVAQIPWLEDASIKNNIVFGLPLDSERYSKVPSACALEKDIEMLPDRETTERYQSQRWTAVAHYRSPGFVFQGGGLDLR